MSSTGRSSSRANSNLPVAPAHQLVDRLLDLLGNDVAQLSVLTAPIWSEHPAEGDRGSSEACRSSAASRSPIEILRRQDVAESSMLGSSR